MTAFLLENCPNFDIGVIGAGFAGLATAYELKKAAPDLRIAVLEAKTVGYGASGRNGSFAMTVVGLGFGTTASLRGKQFLKEAHTYMEKAVDYLDEFIQREQLDCDRIRPGFLRVATTLGYIKRLQHDIRLMKSLGFSGLDWIDAQETRAMVNSERYLGALWEPRLLLINPVKLVREEKRLVTEMGVHIYEDTPVQEIHSSPSLPSSDASRHCICRETGLRHQRVLAFVPTVTTQASAGLYLYDRNGATLPRTTGSDRLARPPGAGGCAQLDPLLPPDSG
jgi:glycine/D-amino acid oxidase-like deaminating enzyme